MKALKMFLTVIILFVATATFAQSNPIPVIAKHRVTGQPVLMVSKLPTARVTYYEGNNVQAVRNDEITTTYTATTNTEIIVWEQKAGHQPSLVSRKPIQNTLLASNK